MPQIRSLHGMIDFRTSPPSFPPWLLAAILQGINQLQHIHALTCRLRAAAVASVSATAAAAIGACAYTGTGRFRTENRTPLLQHDIFASSCIMSIPSPRQSCRGHCDRDIQHAIELRLTRPPSLANRRTCPVSIIKHFSHYDNLLLSHASECTGTWRGAAHGSICLKQGCYDSLSPQS